MIVAAILLATKLTPGVVAMSLETPPADRVVVLREALTSDDARVRGAAARIIAVTDARDVVDDARAALAKETNAEAAREEVRAIGMSGGMKDLDAFLASAKKFGLEREAWTSLARGNGVVAVNEMLARKTADITAFEYGLAGHPEIATPTTARILGMGDPAIWGPWLSFLSVAEWPMAPQIAEIAIAHPNAAMSERTIEHLAGQYASAPPADPKPLLDALDRAIAAKPDVGMRAAIMREMLARALGREKKQRDEWMQWLRDNKYAMGDVKALMTRAEVEANGLYYEAPGAKDGPSIEPIGNSVFTAMRNLPKGAAEEVIDATKCDGDWIGFATAEVDRAGRIVDADANKLWGSDRCKRALHVLLRASLATPRGMPRSGRVADLLLAHHGAADNCFDEVDVDPNVPGEPVKVGHDVTAPKKIKSVEPVYPESARADRESGIIIFEANINRNGCVTAIRILKPLSPRLNNSALLALSQWRFTPGLLDGKPVDVVYNLTINFKLK